MEPRKIDLDSLKSKHHDILFVNDKERRELTIEYAAAVKVYNYKKQRGNASTNTVLIKIVIGCMNFFATWIVAGLIFGDAMKAIHWFATYIVLMIIWCGLIDFFNMKKSHKNSETQYLFMTSVYMYVHTKNYSGVLPYPAIKKVYKKIKYTGKEKKCACICIKTMFSEKLELYVPAAEAEIFYDRLVSCVMRDKGDN